MLQQHVEYRQQTIDADYTYPNNFFTNSGILFEFGELVCASFIGGDDPSIALCKMIEIAVERKIYEKEKKGFVESCCDDGAEIENGIKTELQWIYIITVLPRRNMCNTALLLSI